MVHYTLIDNFREIFRQYIVLIMDLNETSTEDEIQCDTSFRIPENIEDPIEIITQKFTDKFAYKLYDTYYYEMFKEIFDKYFDESTYDTIRQHLIHPYGCFEKFVSNFGEYPDLDDYFQEVYKKSLIESSSNEFLKLHPEMINNIINECIGQTTYLK